MKTLLSLVLLLLVMQGSAQRKKKNKEDARDAQIDTLTMTNNLLTKQIDSISKDRALYYGMYTVVKEKVMLKDFDPARFNDIVDSIRTSRDSATVLAGAPVGSLRDSLATMTRQNMQLKERVDSLSVAPVAAPDKSKLIAELKDLKSLLDTKAITQAEYDEKKKLVMNKWQ